MGKFATGKHARAICDRCGFEYPYLTLRSEWNGLRVCNDCWEPKHPQLEPRKAVDSVALANPRPISDPTNALKHVYGVQLHSAVGVPTFRTSKTLAGASGTGAVGTVQIDIGHVLFPSGVSGTGAVGTMVPTALVYPTGIEGTGSVGTVGGEATYAVAGVVGTGAVGTVAVSVDSTGWGADTWSQGVYGS